MGAQLESIVMAWEKESLYNRLDQCRFMLKVHGYLTDGENDRVVMRLDKALKKQGLKRVLMKNNSGLTE